jgi:RNA-binding protein YhbY
MVAGMKFQIGKNGITEGTIQGLNNALKTHKNIRISVFKSSGRDRESIKVMAKEIQYKLSHPTTAKIIGFTIILRRKSIISNKNP